MYLKNLTDRFHKVTTFFHRFTMNLSIRTRLTLFYTLAAFLLLLFITLLLYWETMNIVHRADYRFLEEEVDHIRYLLSEQSLDQTELKRETIDLPRISHNTLYRYYIRLLDENKLITETPGMNEILPNRDLKQKGIHLHKKIFSWHQYKHSTYLLLEAPLHLKNNKNITIQIALDISYQHALTQDRKIFIMCMMFSTLFALILGFFITQKGMNSLYGLTETVKKITSSSLNQRINPKNWPKELEELGTAFNQMLDRIELAFMKLKQLSSELAHELRTPINNMIVQTEVTLSHETSLEKHQQVLESNLENLQRLSQLTENILFLSKTENPRFEMKKQLLNVMDEIAIICEYHQPLALEKNININYTGNGHLYTNSMMFRRMISNILSNSLKYTNDNGEISISVREVENRTLQIITKDNGCGIAAEDISKIFDRFYRANHARESQGTGLGLAIVKSIADLHSGTISVVSHLNQGTTITLTFPT